MKLERSRLGDDSMVGLWLGGGGKERGIAVIPSQEEDEICYRIDECTLPEGYVDVLGANVLFGPFGRKSKRTPPKAA